VLEPEPPDDLVQIERLKLAAWLLLNGQHLLYRRLEPDGKLVYMFQHSPDIEPLMKQWGEKTPQGRVLVRFSNIVSFEIRKAVRMRREAGLSTRLRGADKT
jgi:hypothetical protein